MRDLYYQIHLDPALKQIETEEIDSVEKGLSTNFKALQPKFGRALSSKTKKVFESYISPSLMYNRVEELLQSNRYLDDSIQFFLRSNQPAIVFRDMCKILQEKFNFPVPKEIQEKLIFQHYSAVASGELQRLSEKSGYVRIKDDFEVCALDEKIYCLKFNHPLNDFLEPKEHPVSILIYCNVSSLTPTGQMVFGKGEKVRITCVGKIV